MKPEGDLDVFKVAIASGETYDHYMRRLGYFLDYDGMQRALSEPHLIRILMYGC